MSRTPSSVASPSGEPRVGDRDRLDDRGPVAPPGRVVGGDGAVDALDAAKIAPPPAPGDVSPSIRISCGSSAPSPMPDVLERHQPFLGVAGLGDRVGVGGAELQVGGGEDQRQDHRHAGAGGEPAPPRDRLGPARPGAACLVVGAPVRPVEPRPELRQHDRQQRDRDQGRDERDQHPAVAHRAQERQRQRDQRQQADRDGDPAEDDRAAGGLHRPLHGLVARAPVGALLAPARDDDQRVVDRDAEAEQGDQELDDRRDRGQLGQAEQEQEGGHDRGDRHQQRDDREEGGEDEGEHEQRAERRRAAPRAGRPGPRRRRPSPRTARRSRSGARAAPPTVAPSSAALAAFSACGFSPNGRVGVGLRVDDREGGPAVVGDEGRRRRWRRRRRSARPAAPRRGARRSAPGRPRPPASRRTRPRAG